MSDELRFRRPIEADHARIVGQVDDWWGGRRLHDILPRLWFQHFTGTSWVAEDASGRLVGFLVGFISPDHPDEAYIHMVGTSPNHRRRGLGRALYERFFEDVAGRGARRVDAVTWPGQPRCRSAFHRAMGFEPATGPGTQNLYGTPAYPTTTPRAATGSSSAGNCDRRRRQLLVEQAPEPGGTLGFRHGLEPAPEERLALGVDEDVGPPQRMLDELERASPPRAGG